MGLLRDIRKYLKENLDSRRYRHVLSVRKTALRLSEEHGKFRNGKEKKEFLKKVSLAALLHDVDKCRDTSDLKKILKKDKVTDFKKIKSTPEVYHAFSGAVTAKDEFGIDDPDILNSIRYHTTGRKNMGFLEKIIYLADYIEPGRDFDGVEKVRKIADEDLDKACIWSFRHVMDYLKEKKKKISPYTEDALEYLLSEH